MELLLSGYRIVRDSSKDVLWKWENEFQTTISGWSSRKRAQPSLQQSIYPAQNPVKKMLPQASNLDERTLCETVFWRHERLSRKKKILGPSRTTKRYSRTFSEAQFADASRTVTAIDANRSEVADYCFSPTMLAKFMEDFFFLFLWPLWQSYDPLLP